jgi:transposase
MALRMRQSVDAFERAFHQEMEADRIRRERLRRAAVNRSRQRRREQIDKRGTVRFSLLVVILIATAVVVTLAMFQTLYWVMG